MAFNFALHPQNASFSLATAQFFDVDQPECALAPNEESSSTPSSFPPSIRRSSIGSQTARVDPISGLSWPMRGSNKLEPVRCTVNIRLFFQHILSDSQSSVHHSPLWRLTSIEYKHNNRSGPPTKAEVQFLVHRSILRSLLPQSTLSLPFRNFSIPHRSSTPQR